MPAITKEKTNIDYLRECIKGNDEANEFLDGIVAEHSRDISHLNHKINGLKEQLDEEQPEAEYANAIDAGIGEIKWEADALPLQSLMETLCEKLNLKKINPLKIENLLNAL